METATDHKSMRGRKTTLQDPKVPLETRAGNPCRPHRTPSRPLEATLEVVSAPRYLCTRGLCGRSGFDHPGGRVRRQVPGAGHLRGETWRATVCKSLQAWQACLVFLGRMVRGLGCFRIKSFAFNRIRVSRKLAISDVLAHHLPSICAKVYGQYSTGSGQIAGTALPSPLRWEQRQAPDGLAREAYLRCVEHHTCCGSSFNNINGMGQVPEIRIRASESRIAGAMYL